MQSESGLLKLPVSFQDPASIKPGKIPQTKLYGGSVLEPG